MCTTPRAAASIPTASPAITISRPSRSTCRRVLKTLAHTDEVQTYLESRHPQNPEYQALRVELEALKASAGKRDRRRSRSCC